MEIGKQLLYLSEADERRLDLSMDRIIDVLEEVHAAHRQGKTQMPPKPGLRPVGKAGFIDGYPAFVENTEYLGIKWLSGYFGNPAKGLPFITGLTILNDVQTGIPVCVMGCGYLTALRTAGIHGAALRRLTKAGDRILGVVGCGLQARTHLMMAMTCCPEITDVYCWSLADGDVERYTEDMAPMFPDVKFHAAACVEDAVRPADVLLIGAPLLPDGSGRMIGTGLLKPGVTVVAVNGDSSFLTETLPEFDRVVVDDLKQYPVRKEMGMLGGGLTDVCDEIAAMVMGEGTGRTSDQEKILVATEGVAINDVSCARVMYETALAQNVGTLLPL